MLELRLCSSPSASLLALRGIIGTIAAAALLCGCPHPNTYGTPRTTPAGKIAHTVAVEAYQFKADRTTTDASGKPTTVTETYTFPTFPTYQLRVGVHDMVDIGARLANLSSVGLDVKVNPLRTQSFDLAFAPGLQWFSISAGTSSSSGGTSSSASASLSVFYFHLPLLLGINLSDSFTIVLSPGAVISKSSAQSSSSDYKSVATASAAFARFGIGFAIRVSDGFALQPEFTAMRSFKEEAGNPMIVLLGLGFNFGKLPERAGMEGAPMGGPMPR